MYRVSQLEQEPGCEAVYSPYSDREIVAGFTSDLLSDVMGNCPEDAVLITIQAHTNTIAVATLVGVAAVLVCSSRPIPDEMIAAARSEDIPLLRTDKNQFAASCMVGQRL